MVKNMAKPPVFTIKINDKMSAALKLIRHALTAKKNNSDEWMIDLVKLSNNMFLQLGEEKRLRYNNGEIEVLL